MNKADNVEVIGDLIGEIDGDEIVFYQHSKDHTMITVADFPESPDWPRLLSRILVLDHAYNLLFAKSTVLDVHLPVATGPTQE